MRTSGRPSESTGRAAGTGKGARHRLDPFYRAIVARPDRGGMPFPRTAHGPPRRKQLEGSPGRTWTGPFRMPNGRRCCRWMSGWRCPSTTAGWPTGRCHQANTVFEQRIGPPCRAHCHRSPFFSTDAATPAPTVRPACNSSTRSSHFAATEFSAITGWNGVQPPPLDGWPCTEIDPRLFC